MSSDTPSILVPGGIRRKPVPDAHKRPPSPEVYDVLDDYYDGHDSNPPPYSLVEQPREHVNYQPQDRNDVRYQMHQQDWQDARYEAQDRPKLPPKAATTPLPGIIQSGVIQPGIIQPGDNAHPQCSSIPTTSTPALPRSLNTRILTNTDTKHT
ncbi:hypothetical protein PG984_011294 [Apiospora sp. TS-2023a]